jgi:hypothetical protein
MIHFDDGPLFIRIHKFISMDSITGIAEATRSNIWFGKMYSECNFNEMHGY